MGDILGSLFGGQQSQQVGQQAANADLTGFNYLSQNPEFQQYLGNGSQANSQIAALLGLGGNQAAANKAFQNYLGSTGYNFQLQQGQNAVGSSMASKGLLNSGATGKALTSYGQNLGSQYFNNYLGQLTGLSNAGLSAGQATGEAGTVGGGNAGQAIYGAGMNSINQYQNAIGGLGSDFGKLLGGSSFGSLFI